MATLNIKNFPDKLHRKLRAQAKRQRRSLSQEVVEILTRATEEPALHSIMEFEGLGAHIWRGVDAARYVAELRDEWER